MVRVGLLWFDDDPKREVDDKVRRAAQRYHEKHGRWPNTCYIHGEAGSGLTEGNRDVAYAPVMPDAKIRLVSAPNILVHHYWLGESLEQGEGKAQGSASLAA